MKNGIYIKKTLIPGNLKHENRSARPLQPICLPHNLYRTRPSLSLYSDSN